MTLVPWTGHVPDASARSVPLLVPRGSTKVTRSTGTCSAWHRLSPLACCTPWQLAIMRPSSVQCRVGRNEGWPDLPRSCGPLLSRFNYYSFPTGRARGVRWHLLLGYVLEQRWECSSHTISKVSKASKGPLIRNRLTSMPDVTRIP